MSLFTNVVLYETIKIIADNIYASDSEPYSDKLHSAFSFMQRIVPKLELDSS